MEASILVEGSHHSTGVRRTQTRALLIRVIRAIRGSNSLFLVHR